MKIFRFMLKKEMRLWLVCTTVLLVFSAIVQIYKFHEAYESEPYYSQAFEELSQSDDPYTEISEAAAKADKSTSDIYDEIVEYIYGDDYNPADPPKVISSELMEQLFDPDKSSGTYAPTVDEDMKLLDEMEVQVLSQSTYRQKAEDQIENYSRNIRRGMTDEYLLALAGKLTEDYTAVLETELDKPTDTRGANALSNFMREDFICFFGIFVLLFHGFSSEIQSGRYAQFAISKGGASKFSGAKIMCGFVQASLFFVLYCAMQLVIMYCFSTDNSIWNAPVQVLSGYTLSPEGITVLEYFLIQMGFKFLYILALTSVLMLVSYLCKRTIVAAGAGVVVTLIPTIVSKTYNYADCVVSDSKLKIILSCDSYNLLHDMNYVEFNGTPVKLYFIYIASLVLAIIFFSLLLRIISAKRGAVNV